MGTQDRIPFSGYVLLGLNFLAYLGYYSVKKVSKYYLKEGFNVSAIGSKYYDLFFAAIVPIFHIVGVASDDFYGKYFTVMVSLFVYLLGIFLIALFSINHVISVFAKFPLWSYLLPTALIILGKGSLHPLMPSYASDQVLSHLVNANNQMFALIYVTTELGRFLPQFYTTKFTYIQCFGYPCYFGSYILAFFIVLVATVLVFLYKDRYREIPHPHQFLFYKMAKIMVGASYNYIRSSRKGEHSNFLKYYSTDHKLEHFYIDMRRLYQVFVVILPLILYFALVSQVEDTWSIQNKFMSNSTNDKFFNYDNMEALTNVLKMIIVLVLAYFVYPMLNRNGKVSSMLQRMGLGYILVLLASLISIILDYKVLSTMDGVKLNSNGDVISCVGCIPSIAQLPQWLLYALGEALVLPSALQFVTIASGDELKTTAIAIWIILTPLFGDRVADKIEGEDLVQISTKVSWIFFACGLIGFIIYALLAKFWYEELTPEIEEVGMDTKVLKHYARIS